LQKDPKQRLQAIGEARVAIEETLSATPLEAAAVPPPGIVSRRIWRRSMPWAAGILLALVVGIAVWELRPRPDAPQIVQFSFGSPAGDSLAFRFGATPLAISRDGTEVVFLVRHSGATQLYLRRMDRLESGALKGTDNADNPFFSPDGQWVGFFADGKLKKVSVLGGTPVTLCDASISRGGTWAPDDSIIFAPSSTSGLMRVSATGGTPQPFTRLDSSKGERTHRWPQVLPGGKAAIYASGSTFNSATVVATLKTGNVKTLPLRGGYARYVTGGYLVFERPDGLFASSFDLDRLEVTGSPFPVLQVLASPVNGVAAVAVSETGSLVYVPGGATIGNLAWVDRNGVLETVGAPARDYFPRIQLSPEGKRIVVVIQEGGSRDVWVYDILRGTLTRLTFGEGDNASPILSPDGQRIAFTRFKDGSTSILAKPADGRGSEETLLPAQASTILPGSWSPNGKFLAYSQSSRSGKLEIWVVPLEGEHKPQPLMANQFDEVSAAFSPDGKYLAYASNESGHNEVYVIPFGQGSGKWQISTGGGNLPVWARNGKELFYRYRGDIMGVDVTTQPVFKASAPRAIVPAKALASLSSGLDNFDVGPDGQRFLIHQQSSEAGQTLQINVVLNWNQELQRLTPAAKQP
jgi:serine/threonine-protein kinase